MGAETGELLAARAEGGDRRLDSQDEVEPVGEGGAEGAGVLHETPGPGDRRLFFDEVGELDLQMGAGGTELLLHLLQDLLHLVQGDLLAVLVEDLYEAAHVGPLEVMGEIHKEVDPGHGMLEFLVLVHHDDGVGDIFYPHLVDGNSPGVPGGLHVGHGSG